MGEGRFGGRPIVVVDGFGGMPVLGEGWLRWKAVLADD